MSIFLALALLFQQSVMDKRDIELPPDLTHVAKVDGLSYTMKCQAISVSDAKVNLPPHDEFVCSVTARVEYDDERKAWTQPIAITRELNHEKAVHEGNAAGERWMAKIRAAITKDEHERGHGAKEKVDKQ